ncbi:MAG: glycosyltransferase family 2 protein [Bacteroidia bacterium]|nr:glycosyltransferase family 2 protein [Bacteroidia bacterium]
MNNPEISVIIPSYNGEKFIADALESVRQQTFPVKEILVVDDGSTDATIDIVKGFPGNIRVCLQKHTGFPAKGRNKGIKESTGTYIAFLDQDDLWPSNAMQIHMESMIKYPFLEVDVGKVQTMVIQKTLAEKPEFGPFGLPKQFFLLSCVLIKKTTFNKVGMFDEQMKYYGSDFDWIIRFREAELSINFHTNLTLYYRLHETNHSRDLSILKQSLIEVFKKSMDRRSASGRDQVKPLPQFNSLPG